MLIHRTDSGYQAGIKESFDAGTKFHGGLLRSSRDIGFEYPAPSFHGRTAFGIQRSERRTDAIGGFGLNLVDLRLHAPAKIVEGAVGSLLQQRARFAGTGFEFQGSFLSNNLLLFHQADQLTVGDTRGDGFKFSFGVANGLFNRSKILWDQRALGTLCQAPRAGAELFNLLGKLVHAIVSLADELIIVAGNFAEAPLEMAENLLAGRIQLRIELLLRNPPVGVG